jgi:hypothetical protein
MRSRACILIVLLVLLSGCRNEGPPPKQLTEAEVLTIAEPALKADMPPEYVDRYKPYRVELQDGVWHVFGTLPGGGPGGTPEARVRDRDGKVLQVSHSQ